MATREQDREAQLKAFLPSRRHEPKSSSNRAVKRIKLALIAPKSALSSDMTPGHTARGSKPMEVARTKWVATALLLVAVTPSRAAMDETRLLEFHAGSALSQSVRSYQSRGFELSDGTLIVFGDWYRSKWPDTHMTFLTPISANVGVIWGFGTGEKGGQYEIQPSVKVGFVAIRDISENETLTFSVRGIVGGNLGERPCRAGYGAIGGSYLVNCRLAATTMRPADTLDHLFDSPPLDRFSFSLRYRLEF